MDPVLFPRSQLEVRLHQNRLQVIKKLAPGSLPSICVLTPRDLKDYVHSAVIKKMKPFFVSDQTDPFRPDFTCGYEQLPDELLRELLEHLSQL